ncbi:uncharacterized protein LOC129002841 [Macrosteles quadrilineatus]|uniref:uncharacterized protein LOC129002841 n=1 Tax=Macrosteles quadrilineatus TaxID=74068 RepID=UPI0023E27505|nr:uncharacterized protein LOC129002841 [Macrosteles quadrilineatus]
MDPLNLPEEVTEQIFCLLPVEDLLSCCLVNCDWRNAVNKNVIWKRHCSTKLDLENMTCVVSPAFEITKIDSESLTPICDYRLKYMHEVHLYNNFRNNRCKEYKFSRGNIDKTELINKYLLLNEGYKNMFHVWDIEGTPFQVQSVPYLLQQMNAQLFQAVGDSLLIVQCNLLQVYIIIDGVVSLKLCRIFDKEEDFSDKIPDINKISTWYSDNIGWYPCDFTSMNEVVGNYFIGIIEQSHGKDSVMHIWDLTSGNKLKEEIIPVTDESVENICTGRNSSCLFIALYLNSRGNFGGIRCKIYSYDLKKLEYTQFYVESNHSIPFMLFEEKVVVLPCDQWENSGSYVFHNSVTGEKIAEKHFDNPMNPKALDSNNQVLVFGSGNTVTVVDLVTLKVLVFFSVDFEVIEVHLLTNNILLVGGVDYHFVLEVWDIKRTRKLYTLGERSIMMCARSLPRLCLQSMYAIHVSHYW